MSFETQDVERKILSILKVLHNLQRPAGARVVAQHLKEHGVALSERAVRYHLKLMDERGLTALVGNHDGRAISEKGLVEIKSALVKDKVGYAISKIESLAFRTDFDYERKSGAVPVNLSFFNAADFPQALRVMRPAFDIGFCASKLVATVGAGQRIGEAVVPAGKIGLVTVCSIVLNGALLKAGIPMDSKFSGVLQIRNGKPLRFTEIIHYAGCSLDPSEIFIKASMTSVKEAVSNGSGAILANFREVPAICLPLAERVLAGLKSAGIKGILVKGNTSEPVCEVPVEPNKIGLVLVGGLNPVAAAQEAGFEVENQSMSTVMDYRDLGQITELMNKSNI